MSRIWKEKADPSKHRDYMNGAQDAGGLPVPQSKDNLIESWVYFVNVVGCTFQFVSVSQIREALAYFECKTHPSTRIEGINLEHYWQHWYERLPKGITSNSKRSRVVKALKEAVYEFEEKPNK